MRLSVYFLFLSMMIIAISVSATCSIHRLCFSTFFHRDRGYTAVMYSVLSLCVALTSFSIFKKKLVDLVVECSELVLNYV